MLTFEQARQASHHPTLKTPPRSRHHRSRRSRRPRPHPRAKYQPPTATTRPSIAPPATATPSAPPKQPPAPLSDASAKSKPATHSPTPLAPKTCIQIMTGAAVPPGADAVVMIEHTLRDGERNPVPTNRHARPKYRHPRKRSHQKSNRCCTAAPASATPN